MAITKIWIAGNWYAVGDDAEHNHDDLYLGINAQAKDSAKLGGQLPSYYAVATHSHNYLQTSGGTISGELNVINSAIPTHFRRESGTGGIYAAAMYHRVMSSGTPSNGIGIGIYFMAPDSARNDTFTGLIGGALTNVTNGAEVGQLKFTPSWHGDDPYDNTVMTLTATGNNTGDLALDGNITLTGKVTASGGFDGKSSDSNKLNGQTASYYAVANHNHNSAYLGISAQAADSAKLNGQSASYYATSNHNHSGVYLGISAQATDSAKLGGQLPSYYAKAQTVTANTTSYIFPKYNAEGVITGVVATAKSSTLYINGTGRGNLYGSATWNDLNLYCATNALATSTAKRYLIGASSTTSLQTQNTHGNVYMQNGELYSNNQKVWNAGNLTFTVEGTTLIIETT